MTTRNPKAEPEGVIRFAYTLEPPTAPPLDAERFAALQGWRTVLRRLGLLGQDRKRYGGLGFGNLSVRVPGRPDQFVITASQTGGVPVLDDEHLVRIVRASAERFWADAEGHQPPSSESLTHAMIYAADPHTDWVFHVHSPEIWARAEALGLPATAADVAYGTPAMVTAVAALLDEQAGRPCVFVTGGHEDGVFACAGSAEAAGTALLAVLARALA
jgi:hypothetical protein